MTFSSEVVATGNFVCPSSSNLGLLMMKYKEMWSFISLTGAFERKRPELCEQHLYDVH